MKRTIIKENKSYSLSLISALKKVILLLLVIVIIPKTTLSQEEFKNSKFYKDWHWGITPYFWLPWVNSNFALVNNMNNTVNIKPGELLDVLDFSILLNTQFQKNRWVGIVDFAYVKVGDNNTVENLININTQANIFLIEALGGYRFGNLKWFLEVVGGARIYINDFKFDAEGGYLGNRNIKRNFTWADMIVGVRHYYYFNPRWALNQRLDIGFIGSEFSWNGHISGLFVISHTVDVFLGFRGLGTTKTINGTLVRKLNLNFYGFTTGVRIKLP